MTMKVYMEDLLSALLHTVQDGKLLAQHPLTAEGRGRVCVYRCDDGYRCAIGCVLDDRHMKEVDVANLNGYGVWKLMDEGIIAFPEGGGASKAAGLLQTCHDSSLSGGIVFGPSAKTPSWMKPYPSLCEWHRTNRGKVSSLRTLLELVQKMGHEDWGSKEAA